MSDTNTYVAGRWHELLKSFQADEAVAQRCLHEITEAYSSPKRHYHNLQHIEALLKMCNQYASRLDNKVAVDLAIFYHDIIYRASSNDNEAQSAVLAGERLQELGVPGNIIRDVKLFIEATKHHQVGEAANRHDLAYFLDFDMSILAAPADEYMEYTRNIRKEYRLYPDILYYPGRKKFIRSTLDNEYIFHSNEFRTSMEARARGNLEKELMLMSSN